MALLNRTKAESLVVLSKDRKWASWGGRWSLVCWGGEQRVPTHQRQLLWESRWWFEVSSERRRSGDKESLLIGLDNAGGGWQGRWRGPPYRRFFSSCHVVAVTSETNCLKKQRRSGSSSQHALPPPPPQLEFIHQWIPGSDPVLWVWEQIFSFTCFTGHFQGFYLLFLLLPVLCWRFSTRVIFGFTSCVL